MVDTSVPLKRCSRKTECLHPEQKDGGWLPATTVYFMLHKGKLYSQCHECRRAAKREAHTRHAEHNNARSKAWYDTHIEEEHEKRRIKNAANPQPARDRIKIWRQENPDKRMEQGKRRRLEHPDKQHANDAVHNAVRRGAIPRVADLKCADCGAQATAYHHESYEREHWLDVVPLCYACHNKRHGIGGAS
jgi:hypothetical protein